MFDSIIVDSIYDDWSNCIEKLKSGGYLIVILNTNIFHRKVVDIENAGFEIRDMIVWAVGNDFIPITLARKPLSENTVAENVLKHGTGGINIDGCRVGHNEPEKIAHRKHRSAGWNMKNTGFDSTKNTTASANVKGRFPSNFIHDGSEEIVDLFPYTKSGNIDLIKHKYKHAPGFSLQGSKDGSLNNYVKSHIGDEGSASRFFKTIKTKQELINYLEKLITPKDGKCVKL